MNKFQKDLLKLALKNYEKTGSSYSEYQMKSADDLMYYTSAAEYLADDDMLVPLSDNIGADNISILAPKALLVYYELTEQGLAAARQLDMEK